MKDELLHEIESRLREIERFFSEHDKWDQDSVKYRLYSIRVHLEYIEIIANRKRDE